jgi:uncharacterized protein YkwD
LVVSRAPFTFHRLQRQLRTGRPILDPFHQEISFMQTHLMPVRFLFRLMAVVGVLGTVALQNPASSYAQAAGTTPIPVSIGWNQETLNGLNAINNFRAQQNPPQEPLQVDAALQYAAAWEVNDQMTNGQWFGQRASQQQPNYYPYAPLTSSPLSSCPHTDSLGRDPLTRIAAFGYTGGTSENANFGASDTTPTSITKGQNAFQGWYDLADPDANGNPTYAHRKNLIDPQWRVVGLAEQCDAFGHRCFWVFDPGTCLMQAFTPSTGAPNPSIPQDPQNPVPACAGAGTPVQLPAATLQPPAVPSFTGTWTVDNFDGGVGGGPISLTQTGNQVTGMFSSTDPSGCAVNGTLTGTLNVDVLTFSTNYTPACVPGNSGETLRLVEDGQSFVGVGIRWDGIRSAGAAAPTPAPVAQPTATLAPVATGVAGARWVIGTNGQLTAYNAQVANPQTVDGLAVRVALGPGGQPWAINANGAIYRRSKGPTSYVDGLWQQLPGSAQSLGIGGDGTAWMVGVNTSVSTFTPTINAWNPDPDQPISYFRHGLVDLEGSRWSSAGDRRGARGPALGSQQQRVGLPSVEGSHQLRRWHLAAADGSAQSASAERWG